MFRHGIGDQSEIAVAIYELGHPQPSGAKNAY